jgi:hypothetical protein
MGVAAPPPTAARKRSPAALHAPPL